MAKKNLRTIPPPIRARLERLPDRNVVAAVLRVIPASNLRAGTLGHLGVELTEAGLIVPSDPIVPPEESGKYSDWNRNGREVIRKDLPKETHYHSVETPNWGDRSYGTHDVDLPYKKYPRDFYAPILATISIACADPRPGREQYGLTFRVDRVLDRQSEDFEADLLAVLNLLQENVGACGVEPSGVQLEDYLRTFALAWEVLPPGTREEAVARLFTNRAPSAAERTVVEARYDFLMSLSPQRLVYGTSGFQRYFGALLADDLVVFENIEYGNAIYVMFGDWQTLSQRSRTELLSGRFGDSFERILHIEGWEQRVRQAIAAHQ